MVRVIRGVLPKKNNSFGGLGGQDGLGGLVGQDGRGGGGGQNGWGCHDGTVGNDHINAFTLGSIVQ